jgi:hypothetical protein
MPVMRINFGNCNEGDEVIGLNIGLLLLKIVLIMECYD